MKKIAFVIGSLGRGGAERVISILANDYAENGYLVDILLLLDSEVGYNLHKNVNVIDFSCKTTSRLKRLPYWLKSLKNYAKKEKPSVIVSFVARINVLVLLSCRKYVSKIFVSERNDPSCDGRSRIIDMLTKTLYKKADKVIFQTKRAKAYFPKLKNGVIIGNPISVKCSLKTERERKIVNVGRLMPQKNQSLLIDAFSEVYKKHGNYALDIYGEGVLRDELQSKIEGLGISDVITLKGNVIDIHERLSTCEIFVLSSNYEGLSNALLEAMTLGLPCVSTNCAGADEVIVDGENGFIVPVGDKDRLVASINALIESEELRNSFSEKSKAIAKIYDVHNVIKLWRDTIEE